MSVTERLRETDDPREALTLVCGRMLGLLTPEEWEAFGYLSKSNRFILNPQSLAPPLPLGEEDDTWY